MIKVLVSCVDRKRMLADQCLRHHWLSQDVTYMRAKKLSTCTHRKFLLRRKWQVSNSLLLTYLLTYLLHSACVRCSTV